MFEPIVEPIVQTLRRVKPRENASEITHKILELLKLFSYWKERRKTIVEE